MFDFIGKRKYFFVISALVILAGIIGFIARGGFVLDIQFQGGAMIEMEMKDDNYQAKDVEKALAGVVKKEIHAQKSYDLNAEKNNERINLLVVTVATADKLSEEERTAIVDTIEKNFNVKEGGQFTERYVHPSIGNELRAKGVLAVLIASVLMLLYIWIRFNIMSGLFAGVTAVIALIHDAAVMLSVYTILGIPLDESFIAAVLTILGYSMNDTIVIYDRIRENSRISRKDTIAGLVNKSIIQSLSRSINTVATTLVCVLTIYLFASYNGIESIKQFTMPLLVGLASGTYSSIFIASPLWVMWKESQARKKTAGKAVKA
ncbi:MAG: protein translocase subunit SecF [Bacillota bacterium]